MDGLNVVKFNNDSALLVYSDEQISRNGKLFLLVSNSWVINNKNIVGGFFRKFYATDEVSPISKLEFAIKEVGVRCIGFWIVKDLIYAVGYENSNIFLIRNKKLVSLLKFDDQFYSISGKLQKNDIILASVDKVESEEISKIFSGDVLSGNIDIKNIDLNFEENLVGFILQYSGEQKNLIQSAPIQMKDVVSDRPQDDKMVKLAQSPIVDRNLFKETIDKFNFLPNLRNIRSLFLKLLLLLNKVVTKFPSQEHIYALENNRLTEKVKSRNKRIVLSIALMLLVSLSASIVWGIKERRSAEWEQKFGIILQDLRYKIQEGKQIAELNPDRARDLVGQATNMIDTLEQRGLAEEDLIDLKNELGDVLGLASGKSDVETKTWLNLGLIRAEMQADDMREFGNNIALIDKTEDRLVLVGIEDKSGEVLAARQQLGEVQYVGIYDDRTYVLSDKGIIEFDQISNVIFPTDDEWGKVYDMKLFAANIYLASTTGIWKYPIIETGYGNKQSWLGENVDSISQGEIMEIDGFIWIAGKDGSIRKFARGIEDNFVISGLDKKFDDITDIYADEDSVYLYVLDADNSRIVSFDKVNGKYKKQYVSNDFNSARSIVVREDLDLILVLVGDRILSVQM